MEDKKKTGVQETKTCAETRLEEMSKKLGKRERVIHHPKQKVCRHPSTQTGSVLE